MVSEAVFLLLVLGVVNHQVTHILTTSVLFEGLRQRVRNTFGYDSKFAYLVTCHLCAGTWIGFVEALVITNYWGLASLVLSFTGNRWVDYVLLAFAVGFVGRLTNEIMGYLSGVVYEREWHQRQREEWRVEQLMSSVGNLRPFWPEEGEVHIDDDDEQMMLVEEQQRKVA